MQRLQREVQCLLWFWHHALQELQSTLFLGRNDLQSKMRSLQVCQHDHQRVQRMRFQLQSLLWFSNGMYRLLRRHVPGWLSMYSRVPCGEVSGQPKQPQQVSPLSRELRNLRESQGMLQLSHGLGVAQGKMPRKVFAHLVR